MMNGSRVTPKIAGIEIEREDQIAGLDQDQGERQRRRVAHALAADEEPAAVIVLGHAHVPAQELEDPVVLEIGLALALGEQPDAARDDDRGEHVNQPVEPGQQRRAGEDHAGAHAQRAQHAPEQHPVLVLAWDLKMAEDQDEHEDVVDRQALFEQEAGQVLEPLGRALQDEDGAAEQQRDADVAGGQEQGFAHADRALLPADDPEVEGEQRHQGDGKAGPEPG